MTDRELWIAVFQQALPMCANELGSTTAEGKAVGRLAASVADLAVKRCPKEPSRTTSTVAGPLDRPSLP